MLNDKWSKIVSKLDFAFQPIINIKSGKIYAVEALLRNVKNAGGFYSIFNLFDEAFHDGILYQLDIELRDKAFEKFSKIKIDNLKIFYNLDNRILYMPDFKVGNTEKILEKFNLDKSIVCFELSERGTLQDPSSVTNMVRRYKQSGFKIAIDDFGTGIAGFQMLYYSEADFIKIDRFFIQNIQNDNKKRLFCLYIINMAHIMGINVIAEGIETKEEYYTCKEIGADFIQGYFAQKPKIDISQIVPIYTKIKKIYDKDQRKNRANTINSENIEYIEALYLEDLNFKKTFRYFKKNKEQHFIPLIDKQKQLKGILYEKDVRDLSYSQYGMSLAFNNIINIKEHIKNVICAENSWSIDKILEKYNTNRNNSNGIFITKNGKYHGFISLNNLLHLSYKRNLDIATEKNPLTKLPGNKAIENFFTKVFDENRKNFYTFVYFDFNDFKPFNDYYGFRKGDRAILLFRDLLKKKLDSSVFVAHIGGDDFFIGFKNINFQDVYQKISCLQEKFKDQASSIYTKKDRENGYIETKDRFGILRKFNLLSVSAAIIEIYSKNKKRDYDKIIGELKKESKKRDTPLGSCII